jgi:hypothetical protein
LDRTCFSTTHNYVRFEFFTANSNMAAKLP